MGNGERGKIKRLGAGEEGNESAPPIFLISQFSLSFPRFLAVSPLEEPLQRRDLELAMLVFNV